VDTSTKLVPRLLLTVAQVGEALQVGRTTVYRLIQAGELATVHVGRAVRVPRASVEAWLGRQLAESAQATTDQGSGA
jgi:excisionase family DNA binding protein